MTRLTPTALAIAALLLLGGCGGGSATPETDGPIPDAAVPVDVRSALGTPSERYASHRAEMVLIRACMQAQGFEFRIPSERDLLENDRWSRLDTAYQFGPAPGSLPKGFGLVASADAAGTPTEDRNAEVIGHLSVAEQERWDLALSGSGNEMLTYEQADGGSVGMPADGCRTEARLEVFGSFGSFVELELYSGSLASKLTTRVLADARYERARVAWSKCAKEHGRDFEHPSEPVGEVVSALESEPRAATASLEERNYRLAVECEAETHIYALGWKVTEEVLPLVLKDEAGTIARYREVVVHAQEILEQRS